MKVAASLLATAVAVPLGAYAQTTTRIVPPTASDTVFVLDVGNGLDEESCQGDTIVIDEFAMGSIDPAGTSLFVLAPIFDVDDDEKDELFLNDVPVGDLQGANDEWALNTFTYPVDSSPVIEDATNVFRIEVDTDGGIFRCIEVDWVSIIVAVGEPFASDGGLLDGDNGDGADSLTIGIEFDLESDATCQVVASLSDDDNVLIASVTQTGVAVTSVNRRGLIALVFSSVSFCASQRNGPYTLAALVTCDNGASFVSNRAARTGDLRYTDFNGCYVPRPTIAPTTDICWPCLVPCIVNARTCKGECRTRRRNGELDRFEFQDCLRACKRKRKRCGKRCRQECGYSKPPKRGPLPPR